MWWQFLCKFWAYVYTFFFYFIYTYLVWMDFFFFKANMREIFSFLVFFFIWISECEFIMTSTVTRKKKNYQDLQHIQKISFLSHYWWYFAQKRKMKKEALFLNLYKFFTSISKINKKKSLCGMNFANIQVDEPSMLFCYLEFTKSSFLFIHSACAL